MLVMSQYWCIAVCTVRGAGLTLPLLRFTEFRSMVKASRTRNQKSSSWAAASGLAEGSARSRAKASLESAVRPPPAAARKARRLRSMAEPYQRSARGRESKRLVRRERSHRLNSRRPSRGNIGRDEGHASEGDDNRQHPLGRRSP